MKIVEITRAHLHDCLSPAPFISHFVDTSEDNVLLTLRCQGSRVVFSTAQSGAKITSLGRQLDQQEKLIKDYGNF